MSHNALRLARRLAGWLIVTGVIANDLYAAAAATFGAVDELSMIGALYSVPVLAIGCLVADAPTA
jgi:hypothetical protein